MTDGVTKLTITREMAIRALKHMDEYTMPPEDVNRDDMLSYRYLMWKDTETPTRNRGVGSMQGSYKQFEYAACGLLLRLFPTLILARRETSHDTTASDVHRQP